MAEEAVDGAAVQPGGRLVQGDEPDAAGERPGDLHQLGVLDAEPAGEHVHVHRHVPLVQHLAGGPAHLPPADHRAEGGGVPAQEQVLRHGQIAEDRRLLVDAGDAAVPGAPVGEGRRGLAVEEDRSAVRPQESGQDGHQGGLAGAVAADEGVRLAGPDGDPHVVQCHRGPETLGDPVSLGEGAAGRCPVRGRGSGRQVHLLSSGADTTGSGCPKEPGRRRSAWSPAVPGAGPRGFRRAA